MFECQISCPQAIPGTNVVILFQFDAIFGEGNMVFIQTCVKENAKKRVQSAPPTLFLISLLKTTIWKNLFCENEFWVTLAEHPKLENEIIKM